MNNFLLRCRQWQTLQRWEKHLLVVSFALLPAAWFILVFFGFKRARQLAERSSVAGKAKPIKIDLEQAHRYAYITAVAARHGIYKANCLHQSLALCWLLNRQGLEACIRIGVKPGVQPFEAHAWVELGGVPLGQSVDEYRVFKHLTTDPDTSRFV